MATQLDNRQVVQRSALSFIGNAANEALSVLFPRIDAEMAKLYEDRNILLTDGGIITFTGTQIQFTEALNLALNSKISGAAPQVISLGSANINLTTNGQMFIAVIDRTAGTATTSVVSTLPAVTSANQEVFLIVKRVDAGDGTQRIYWRNGMALNAGQSVRLGASGSGSGGSGTGDDLDALLYRASFRDGFDEGAADSKSGVDASAGKTDPNAYSAAKAMYTLNYDASKTVAAGSTTTSILVSSAPTFTVKAGDVVLIAGVARAITAIVSQTSYTVEAFATAPSTGAQMTVSQAVHTKDIYNLPVDGNALSAAFGSATFSDILVDYEDTTASGDNIFDINTTPVVGFVASYNGSSYTSVQVRPTLETTTMTSTTLTGAGTALYLRFFAVNTSGSGIVNVLGYRAFMQKSLTASGLAGGVINSSYAFTNGVGTPVNATVALVGGKTTVTLNWSYALNVLNGTSASSIEVWLNGAKLPRFINSTLTPDGSFTELSANAIQLDRDYSQMNLSVEVFQRTQIVDNSSTNSTDIASAQEISNSAFQGFVSQSKLMVPSTITGTPVAGTFYSSIQNRAPMQDFLQDLKPRLGNERFMTQVLMPSYSEFGPNGEQVWLSTNDPYNAVRFVGNWTQQNTQTYGQSWSSSSLNDYIEITFYGTGLNYLAGLDIQRDIRASVDGGAEGSNIFTMQLSSGQALANRGTAVSMPMVVVSGLAPGVHTVKIRQNGGAANSLTSYGYEVINAPSTTPNIITNPGVAYVGGKKIALTAQSSIAYNANATGTRGGRIVHYLKSDGTIGQSFTPVNSAMATITSTDHTNEEIARTYDFREFGTGTRGDDFALAYSTPGQLVYSLDDATTQLSGNNVSISNNGANNLEYLSMAATGAYLTFTFVGTGLDLAIIGNTNATQEIMTLAIDGTTIGNFTQRAGASNSQLKLVSGLPYGTHHVRITRTAQAGFFSLRKFIVYQPKKPAIPSGAVELADYNVMATFAANTVSATASTPMLTSTGVLRKALLFREGVFNGTWTVGTTINTTYDLGTSVFSATNGSQLSYTFTGTGFDLRMTSYANAGAGNLTLNGVALNASYPGAASIQCSTYGSVLFGAKSANTAFLLNSVSNNVLNLNGAFTSYDAGLCVSGLPFGTYTITFTKTDTSTTEFQCIDIITPIHSYNNLLFPANNTSPVGSQYISDNRKTTIVKDSLPVAKASAQTVGTLSSPTTTSTTLIPLYDMSVTVKTSGGALDITFMGSFYNSGAANAYGQVQIYVDGQAIPGSFQNAFMAQMGGTVVTIPTAALVPVTPGFHTVQIYWQTGSGTFVAQGAQRILKVRET